MRRLLVCGGRDYNDEQTMYLTLINFLPIGVLIEGEARGADSMARRWAEDHSITVEQYPADWKQFGRAAGPIRNQQMIDEGKPTEAVAFYDRPRLESKGTADMVRRLKKAGIPVEEIGG